MFWGMIGAYYNSLLLFPDRIQDWTNVVVAYEPVWAIGTGLSATPDEAQSVHAYLRKSVLQSISDVTASQTRIIYGGVCIMIILPVLLPGIN